MDHIHSHLKPSLEPWSDCTHMAWGMYEPSQIMCPSHDDRATTCHPHHLIRRSPSQQTWDLRVPTLCPSNLFLSYCMLMLLQLLCSGPKCAYPHSQLRAHLYAPLCPICIPDFSTSMQTAALVTDASQTLS